MSRTCPNRIGVLLIICALFLVMETGLVSSVWAAKPVKPKMHVESVIVVPAAGNLWEATVMIRNQDSVLVSGARVTGDWDKNGTVFLSGTSGDTDAGIATILSDQQPASGGDVLTFTVTDVSLRRSTYDESANVATSGSFTVPGVDTTSPKITDVAPVNNAVNVSIATVIAVTFSEPVDPNTVTNSTFTVNDGIVDIGGGIQMSSGDTVATFTPSANLTYNTLHTVTVLGGAYGVKDVSGNPFDQDPGNGYDNFTSGFTTGTDMPSLLDDSYRLSNNDNYYPDIRSFTRSDTLYVQVRSDKIDYGKLKKSEVRLDPWGETFGLVYNTSSGTYTGSRSLNNAPGGQTTVQITITDRARNRFTASTTITIDDTVDEVTYPFQSVERILRITSNPRPLNINVLKITLTDPGINLFVSPGNPNPTPGNEICEEAIVRKTTTFVSEFGLQVGINGDFSDLVNCSSTPSTEGYPASVNGLGVSYRSSSTGLEELPRDQYAPHNNRPALTFTELNEAYIGWYDEGNPFPDEVYNAVGGNKKLVDHGTSVDPSTWDPIGGALDPHPRTSIGLSEDGSKLIIIVVDGRKPGFSEGMTLPEVSEVLKEFGAYTGLNLDGGGSSTMVFGTANGPDIVNYPSDGTERPRPSHLGIYAAPSAMVPLALARTRPEENLPASVLWQNYPNPFNPETWIPFSLSDDAHVVIRIYSLNGGLVRTFDLGYRSMGEYISKDKAVYWNGANEVGESVVSGVYFYNIHGGDFVDTKKMIIAK